MPLYEYRCPQDGYNEEFLMSYDRTLTCEVICPRCENAMIKQVSVIAKTATAWGGNWTEGMSHTYYSKALGRQVANKRQEEQILNDAGFVCETDLGKDWIENKSAEIVDRAAEQDRRAEIYQTTLADTGDEVKAMTEAFPAHDCLDGTLNDLYDQKIEI